MKVMILKGPDAGRTYDFEHEAEITLGRDAACDVQVHDPECSRQHAKLVLRQGRIYVEDLESRNGTHVGGERVRVCPVEEGTEISVGATVVSVLRDEPPPAGRAAGLRGDEASTSLVMAVPHGEADLLTGGTVAASAADMLRENEVLREICRISKLASMEKDGAAVVVSVLDRLHEALQADTVCILRRAGETDDWQVSATSSRSTAQGELSVSRTLVGAAVSEGNAILSADPTSDERFAPSRSIVLQQISSALCSPLRVGGEFTGVLVVDRRRRREVFNSMDLRLAASAGNILGLFLEKEQYEAEARNRARLAVVGEVVAGLAHYIKNIVAGFRLSIQGLQTALQRQNLEYAGNFMRSICSQEERISDLMLNMLSYAKEREPQRARVALRDVVCSVVDPFRDELRTQGIDFVLDVDPAAPAVYAEEVAVHRVLLNLFVNSRDALRKREQGTKAIRVAIAPGDGGRTVELRFRDTGCGIPKDKLGDVFRAFYSTKGSGGTGLGLAVVQKTIEEHGGKVSVDSELDAWTEFRIVLPAEDGSAETR